MLWVGRIWEGYRKSRWASESTRKWAEGKYQGSLEERILKDGFRMAKIYLFQMSKDSLKKKIP